MGVAWSDASSGQQDSQQPLQCLCSSLCSSFFSSLPRGCADGRTVTPVPCGVRCFAVMSANDEHSTVMRGVTHGACDFLIKPVRIEELKNIWQHVVRRGKHNATVRGVAPTRAGIVQCAAGVWRVVLVVSRRGRHAAAWLCKGGRDLQNISAAAQASQGYRPGYSGCRCKWQWVTTRHGCCGWAAVDVWRVAGCCAAVVAHSGCIHSADVTAVPCCCCAVLCCVQVVRDAESDDAPGDQDADSNRKRTVHSRDGSCNEGQVSHTFLSFGSMQCSAVDIGTCCITVVAFAAKGCWTCSTRVYACMRHAGLAGLCLCWDCVRPGSLFFTGETCMLVWLAGTVLC
jgi:hypothetical protein